MLSLSLEKFVTPVLRAVAGAVAATDNRGPILPVSMPVSAPASPSSPSSMREAYLPPDRWSAPMEEGVGPRSVYVKVTGH
jgi:hypothetical protein